MEYGVLKILKGLYFVLDLFKGEFLVFELSNLNGTLVLSQYF